MANTPSSHQNLVHAGNSSHADRNAAMKVQNRVRSAHQLLEALSERKPSDNASNMNGNISLDRSITPARESLEETRSIVFEHKAVSKLRAEKYPKPCL